MRTPLADRETGGRDQPGRVQAVWRYQALHELHPTPDAIARPKYARCRRSTQALRQCRGLEKVLGEQGLDARDMEPQLDTCRVGNGN